MHRVIEADIRRGMAGEVRRLVERETQAHTAELLKVKFRLKTARERANIAERLHRAQRDDLVELQKQEVQRQSAAACAQRAAALAAESQLH